MATRTPPSHLFPALSLGIACQIGQVVMLREFLLVFHGNELTFGIFLGAWMVWVGIGSRLAGRIGERADGTLRLQLAASAALVLLPGTVLAIRLLRSFFDAPPGAYLSIADMLAAALALTAPAGLLLGAVFVLLARAWRLRAGAADTAPAGKTYIAEAAGHAAGGLLFALVLVRHLDSFQAVVGAGLVMAAATLAATGPHARRPLLPGMIVIAAASLPFLDALDGWAHRQQWRSLAPGHELVEIRQSRYGAVAAVRREDQISFFQSGNLLFSAAGAETAEPGFEEQSAVISAHFAMAQHPDPRRILLIGGGLAGMLREIARHGVERIDYVELDPVVTQLALAHLPPSTAAALERGEVRLAHGDGRMFLRGARDRYDLIFVDAPEPATAVLNRYYTEEFFREAAARLGPGGVLAITASSTADARGLEIANRNATIFHTLKRVFPHVLAAGERRLHFFAANEPGSVSADIGELRDRYRARGVAAAGFSPGHFEILLEEGPLRRVNWILRHHGRSDRAHLSAPDTGPLLPAALPEQELGDRELPPVSQRYFINTDFRPIGYVHTLAYWNHLTRADHGGVFRLILRVRPGWIIPPVALALALAAVLPRIRGRRPAHPPGRFPILLAVFTTGLSTMALQVGLLFAFQAIYGFVYEMMGLIVAGFMAGLAIGAACTHRFVRDPADSRILMAVQLAIAICAAAVALALPWSAALGPAALQFAFFMGLAFIAGLLNGVDFPLAAACSQRLTGRADRAAGLVYGTELFGAFAGALVAGVIAAPVLGIVACCLLAAVANATAFLTLWMSRRWPAHARP